MRLFIGNLLLAFVWVVVTANFSWANIGFGFAIGALVLWLQRHNWSQDIYFYRLKSFIKLVFIFFYDLIGSALRVAKQVLTPTLRINPVFVAVPLDLTHPGQITLLANMITLTPGTLSVDVSADHKTLYIHAINASDIDAVKQDIQEGFETAIRDVFEQEKKS